MPDKIVLTAEEKEDYRKEYQKQYRLDHRTRMYEHNKIWRDKHNRTELVTCECGRKVSKAGLKSHKTTKIHTDYIPAVVGDVNDMNNITEFLQIARDSKKEMTPADIETLTNMLNKLKTVKNAPPNQV